MSETVDRGIFYTEEDYINLIPSINATKQNFIDTIRVSVSPFVNLQEAVFFYAIATDIDFSYGVFLDRIGEWVGISRYVDVPITGVFFSWGGSADEGWSKGVWKGQFNPASGITELPDNQYKRLIRSKILANKWDGSIEGIYDILDAAFPGFDAEVIDNQDMTMDVHIDGAALDTLSLALFMGGYIPIKPSGVSITYHDTI